MATEVLGDGLRSCSLGVMVTWFSSPQVFTNVVFIGTGQKTVVSILRYGCDGSVGRSISLLQRILSVCSQLLLRLFPSPYCPATIYSGCILSFLFQPAKPRGLVVLVLRATVPAAPGRTLKAAGRKAVKIRGRERRREAGGISRQIG